MKQVLFTVILSTLSILAIAQKPQKAHYKFQKEFQGGGWSQQKEADYKFVFNFKNKEVERVESDGNRKTYRIASISEATDDQTLEDCKLLFLEYEGEKVKMILYKSEERGLRVIKNDGDVTHYYTK